MERLVLPACSPSHKFVYDAGRGYVAVGIGESVSVYRVSDHSLTLTCSFPTKDGVCSLVCINKNRLTDKVYILVAGQKKIKVFALAEAAGSAPINPLTVFEQFELVQTVSAVAWDPQRVDSVVYCTTNGVLCRLTLGLESTSKYRIELLHEFQELVHKIVFSSRNPRFCFCQTKSDLVVLNEVDSSVQFRGFGIRGLVDFDVSPFGYLAGVTDTQLTMFDIGLFNCKSFDNNLFDSKVMKSVRTELKGMKRIFCDKKLPNLMFAKQCAKDNDFFMQLSMDPKCERRFCKLEPKTVFIDQVDGKFICGTETGVIYVISIGTTFGITSRTMVQAMGPRCLCDVQKEYIAYEHFTGSLCVSKAIDKDIERVYSVSIGQVQKVEWFSDDDCFIALADGTLRKFVKMQSEDCWRSKTLLVKKVPSVVATQQVTNFWVVRNQFICAQIGSSMIVAFDINETQFTYATCKSPRTVIATLNNGAVEIMALPTADENSPTSCVLTKFGVVYYREGSLQMGETTTPIKIVGDLLSISDDRFAVVNNGGVQYFEAETLQPDGISHVMPGKCIRSSGPCIYCVNQPDGLYLSFLDLVACDFVKSNEFDRLDSPILVLSSEDMSKTISYSLGLFAALDPDSPEVDEIGCLSKTEVSKATRPPARELTVDELQRKIFARLGPISGDHRAELAVQEAARKVAEGGYYRRAAILQHTFRKFDEAVDYLLEGKIYELASLYVKLYEINGKDKKIISCAVNEMIEVGDYLEAYQVLKAKQCHRGCMFIRKILGMYDLITDEMIEEARGESSDSIEIEDEINGMLSLEEICAWRDKCLRGEFE